MRVSVLLAALVAGLSAVRAEALPDIRGLLPPEMKTVGIFSAANRTDPADLTNEIAVLERAGYRVKVGAHVVTPTKRQASPEDRAADIMALWLDPEVDILFAERGGKGSQDVAPLLDWARLRARKMPVVGYSNITFLHNAMIREGAGWPIGSVFSAKLVKPLHADTFGTLRRVLRREPLEPVRLVPWHPATNAVSGFPAGGNLPLTLQAVRAKMAPSFRDRIVFLEIGGVKRTPGQLKEYFDGLLAEKPFDGVKAVVLGDFDGCGTKEEMERLCRAFAAAVGCPVYAGYPWGHRSRKLAIDYTRRLAIAPDGTLSWEGVIVPKPVGCGM